MKRTTRLGVAAAVLLAMCGGAIGQGSPAQELAQREQIAQDSSRPQAERLAALERVLEIRREMLQGAPGDRFGADAAAYVSTLLSRMAWDGQDQTALVGVPLAGMKANTLAQAMEGLELTRRAEEWIRRQLGGAALNAQEAALNRALLERQLPVLRARCAAVAAALTSDGAEKTALVEEAIEAVDGLRFDDPLVECRRLSTLGAAQLMQKNGDAAMLQFEQAAAGATSHAMRAEAECGRALAILLARGPDAARAAIDEAAKIPPFVIGGRPEPSAQVAAMDVRYRIERARAEALPEGPARFEAMTRAFDELLSLVRRTDLGLDETQRRGIALGKVATAGEGIDFNAKDAPAVAVFARALALSDQRGRQGEAIMLLRGLIDGGDDRLAPLGPMAPDALWQVAALSMMDITSGGPVERMTVARRALLRLAREYPSHPRATEALEAAVAYAGNMRQITKPDPEYVTLYETTLNDALKEFPEHRARDLWRIEKGRLYLSLDRVNDALIEFDRVAPDSNRAPDAVFLAIQGLASEMNGAETEAERKEWASRIFERMAPSMQVLGKFLQNPPHDEERADVIVGYAALTGLSVTTALFELGRYDDALNGARDTVQVAQLLEEKQKLLTEAQATVLRCRALVKLGRAEEAVELAEKLGGEYRPLANPALPELVDALESSVQRALRSGNEMEASRLARRSLAPAAEAAAAWAAAEEAILLDRYRITQGEALALGGEGERAAEIFEDLMSRRGRETRLVLGLGEAKLAMGDSTGAFDLFKEAAEQVGGDPKPGAEYWQAWSRMLQILAADGGGAKSEQVMREVNRLRVLDANLGGEPYRSRIEASASKSE